MRKQGHTPRLATGSGRVTGTPKHTRTHTSTHTSTQTTASLARAHTQTHTTDKHTHIDSHTKTDAVGMAASATASLSSICTPGKLQHPHVPRAGAPSLPHTPHPARVPRARALHTCTQTYTHIRSTYVCVPPPKRADLHLSWW